MQQENDPLCLSFSSYSTDKLADVAVRVTQEFQNDVAFDQLNNDDQFEFVPAPSNRESVFGSSFPLFNRDLLLESNREAAAAASPVRQPLAKLFIDDRDNDSSSTSSEEAEIEPLEGIEPGTYCVWAPKSPSPSPDLCKKSNSTGNSSKRWRFLRDLLKRSHSDGGKESFELVSSKTDKLTESKGRKSSFNLDHSHHGVNFNKVINSNSNSKAKVNKVKVSTPSSPIRAFYKSTMEDHDKKKRKSFLPYRTFLASFPI